MREESNDGLPEAVQRTQFQALDRVMAMASFDLDGVLRHANRNYLQLLGLTQDQALSGAPLAEEGRFGVPRILDEE